MVKDTEPERTEGKYDAVARELAKNLGANGIFLLVWGGRLGGGMSVESAGGDAYVQWRAMLPDMLEKIAAEIRAQNKPSTLTVPGRVVN